MIDRTTIGECVEACGSWNPSAGNPEGEFCYIDIASVDRDEKRIVDATTIPMKEAPSRARQLVKANDVLVSTVRPNLNAVALVPPTLDGATASTGFTVLRPRVDRIVPGYLFHWVKTPQFVDHMVKQATGASYPAVSDKIVRNAVLPLPVLTEQRRIAAILDKADALRAKRREAIAKLDHLLQSVFLEMFGDPVTNTKSWSDDMVLGDVADIVSGITKGRRTTEKLRTVPYLAVANVQDRHLKLDVVKTIEATESELKKFGLIANDLLLTEGGDPDKLGRGALWDESITDCIHQNHVFRVRVTKSEVNPVYLNWLVGSARGKKYFLRSAKQTTGIASINMSQLRSFPLLVPPTGLQNKFANFVSKIEVARRGLVEASIGTDGLFRTLQHLGFTGKL